MTNFLTKTYRPMSETKKSMYRDINLKRLKIPLGCRKVYGTVFCEEIAFILRPVFDNISREYGREIAEQRAAKIASIDTINAERLATRYWNLKIAQRAARKATRNLGHNHPDVRPMVGPGKGLRDPAKDIYEMMNTKPFPETKHHHALPLAQLDSVQDPES